MLRGFWDLCKRALGDGVHARSADQAALEPIEPDILKTRCPKCKAKGAMVLHGWYLRHFIYHSEGKTRDSIITVIRLMCTSCNTTHAVLPLAAIPYLSYSICFIAALLADWLSGSWPSIDAISAEYGISAKTFIRLRSRFMASVEMAVGKTASKGHTLEYAAIMANPSLVLLAKLLGDFIALTGRMFCEGVPP